MKQSTITVELMADGTVKVDASQYHGTEAEILAALAELAADIGGNLEIERHVHRHGQTHSHEHKIKS